jgi:hypothetical protein
MGAMGMTADLTTTAMLMLSALIVGLLLGASWAFWFNSRKD